MNVQSRVAFARWLDTKRDAFLASLDQGVAALRSKVVGPEHAASVVEVAVAFSDREQVVQEIGRKTDLIDSVPGPMVDSAHVVVVSYLLSLLLHEAARQSVADFPNPPEGENPQ